LGLEYSKEILESNRNIELLPIQRVGGNYNDENLYEDFSSASAIRLALTEGKQLNSNLPSFVSDDLPQKSENNLEQFKKYAILSTPKEEIAKVCDCGEGLENAFKKAAILSPSLTQSLTSARYTASRIRRIALQCLLGAEESLIRKSLSIFLYFEKKML
jgi:predicted nucleotidyltransferase